MTGLERNKYKKLKLSGNRKSKLFVLRNKTTPDLLRDRPAHSPLSYPRIDENVSAAFVVGAVDKPPV